MRESQFPFANRSPGYSIPLMVFALLLLLGDGKAEAAPGPQGDGAGGGRVGCPRCANDGSRVSQLLQQADALYAAFKSREASEVLTRVLQLEPNHHEALSKMARCYLDFGDLIPESALNWQQKRVEQYRIAEKYGRKAVLANPESTWGHFYVAASLGKIASYSPMQTKIDLAKEMKEHVERAIAKDPNNGFAYHVYGVWHREVAEIGQMKRVLASVIYWRSLPSGSIEKSVEYLRHAISLNPRVIVHYFELARTYVALEQWESARDSLQSALGLPVQFSDDPEHKKKARQLLQEIKYR